MQCTKTLSSTCNKKSVKNRLINASSQSRTSDLFFFILPANSKYKSGKRRNQAWCSTFIPGPVPVTTRHRDCDAYSSAVRCECWILEKRNHCSVTSVSLKWFQLYIYSLELLACRRLADRKKYTQCKDPVCLLSSIYHWWWGVQFASIAKKESAYTILDFEENRLFCDTDDLNLKEKCPMFFANATH